jgi:hypothetical protein
MQEHPIQHDILARHSDGLDQSNSYDQDETDSDPPGPPWEYWSRILVRRFITIWDVFLHFSITV